MPRAQCWRRPSRGHGLSTKTDGSGYGRRQAENHGRKPASGSGQRGGFVNGVAGRHRESMGNHPDLPRSARSGRPARSGSVSIQKTSPRLHRPYLEIDHSLCELSLCSGVTKIPERLTQIFPKSLVTSQPSLIVPSTNVTGFPSHES